MGAWVARKLTTQVCRVSGLSLSLPPGDLGTLLACGGMCLGPAICFMGGSDPQCTCMASCLLELGLAVGLAASTRVHTGLPVPGLSHVSHAVCPCSTMLLRAAWPHNSSTMHSSHKPLPPHICTPDKPKQPEHGDTLHTSAGTGATLSRPLRNLKHACDVATPLEPSTTRWQPSAMCCARCGMACTACSSSGSSSLTPGGGSSP